MSSIETEDFWEDLLDFIEQGKVIPVLERALNMVRVGGVESTRTQAFSPGAANKDLPVRRAELAGVTVYHVLGKVSVAAGGGAATKIPGKLAH
jgi:hypothetical protein